jgi:hypothetical protein
MLPELFPSLGKWRTGNPASQQLNAFETCAGKRAYIAFNHQPFWSVESKRVATRCVDFD